MHSQTNLMKGILVGILLIVTSLASYSLGVASERPVPASGHDMHGQMNAMNASLSGKEGVVLDKVFLEEMIVHHEGAVSMAEEVLARGSHPELKELAQRIVSSQTGEIVQMKAWLAAWYGN